MRMRIPKAGEIWYHTANRPYKVLEDAFIRTGVSALHPDIVCVRWEDIGYEWYCGLDQWERIWLHNGHNAWATNLLCAECDAPTQDDYLCASCRTHDI